uniref:Uncharacterized protein n=1 Tax=Kwoniella pini CBS 10737 TaxID=1296096 RepID=A0A1B9HY69_9TREE|nr:uncharacterized protein I206_06093 [Kwoniella pini CBS 10737]OCF48225.1 hypothetical protein I206_06093 [Kwoniella pini CBS 10737]
MPRKGEIIWSTILIIGLSLLALIPFTFYLINSLGPSTINEISLAKIIGEFKDLTTNQSIKLQIKVGPNGGCISSNITEIINCNSHIPYKPFVEEESNLHFNESIISIFPITIGKALVLNHVTTALMGLSVLAVLIDILVLHGGISFAIVYFTIFFMWITFIFESIYVSLLHKRLDKLNLEGWEFKMGEGYWFILAATVIPLGELGNI